MNEIYLRITIYCKWAVCEEEERKKSQKTKMLYISPNNFFIQHSTASQSLSLFFKHVVFSI